MSLAAARLPEPGDVLLGKWRVEAEIGRGGMGVVLKVRDGSGGRPVAMKVLAPEATAVAEAVPRFLNEARAASQLKSAHVVRVYDTGTLENGLPFIVMELLEGADFGTILERRGPLPVADVCDAIIHACDALAEAHARGMVHRDLKPGNLFKTRGPNDQPIVKVLDFGVAKLAAAAQAGGAALTNVGTFLGSPHYMAPEQMKSAKDADARADVWSLGICMYELLTGNLPFDAGAFGALFLQVSIEAAPPITRPDVPPGLIEIIERCMSKKREDRYSDLAALVHSLARFASPDGIARAQKIAAAGPPEAPISSSRMAVFASTIVLPGAPPPSTRTPAAPPPASSPNIGFASPSSGMLPHVPPSSPRISSPELLPYQQQPPPPPPVAAKPVPSNFIVAFAIGSGIMLVVGIVLAVLALRAR
jgi:eukaryotic-like serine/threonine-protein kinase